MIKKIILFIKIDFKTYNYLGEFMRVKYNDSDVDVLGRIMRAEAQGEGPFGMMLVGNVVVNRVVVNCGDFRNIKTIYEAVFQKNQFEGITIPLFNKRATKKEREMAMKCIRFWRADPAYAAIYFQNPGRGKKCKTKFWGPFIGRYKSHCFYGQDEGNCNL